ncbi:DUF222 domain-containing protein [Pimelobacter simplex]|uniref:DUF222 domain-containing protein n=1 Tax=Nocardioides simplex TaxID=2045 RepID=UPI00367264BB
MTTADKQTALVRLAQVESMVHELRLRVLAGADEVGDQSGARDSAAWLSSAAQLDTKAARADRHLAKALDQHPQLAAGMRAGTVSPAQAHIILNGLDDLPGDVDDAVAAAAEHELVGYCADFRPRELRRLTRRLLEVLDPDGAEAAEGSRLEAEERRARERASLRFRDLGNGRTRLWGVLPTPVAQRFEHYLQAYTSPRRRPDEATSPTDAPLVDGRRVPRHRAYAHALAALLENIDPDGLPLHGGDATSVFVTMTLDQVRGELATAGVLAADGESEISATDARRLACQATLLPVVLGGRGEVLDLGRAQRLHRPAQRKAIRLRDRGVPRRELHHAGRLVRDPPPHPVGPGRVDHRRRRRVPLPAPPSPDPRPGLRPRVAEQRCGPLPPAPIARRRRSPSRGRPPGAPRRAWTSCAGSRRAPRSRRPATRRSRARARASSPR